MTCPDCAELARKLAEAERDRDFYRRSFQQMIEAFTAYKRPWWDGMNAPKEPQA